MAGASIELFDSVRVNPFDLDQMADGICEALEMAKKEQTRRMRTMQKRLSRYTVQRWAEDFMKILSKKSELSYEHKTSRITKNLEIEESSIKLNEVKISAEREAMRTEVNAAAIKITKKELEMVPTIGGDPDLAQYIQIIPGVVFTGDQGGQLYIRGGSPIQNKVLLDGMIIYSPFHSIGLFSVFDTDIIRNTDVFTGGFNAEYGGRISSIMDIKTKDGNKKRFGGKITSNTFGSKLLLEGPLSKNQKSSFVFSGKTSYLDKSSEILYKEPLFDFDNKGLPYSYTDLYGKFSLHGNNGSKFNLFGFNFQDLVDYENISKLKWNSNGIGSEFILIHGN